MASEEVPAVLNINVGILGHVDSGKTSIAKALSTIGSTAAFDKNPQSQERGITLDLDLGFTTLQITLVDCPGHASLIRTIIGGAQIIDFMMLVIDVTKGIQTQTAECLVIGEICWDRMIDMLPLETRDAQLEKVKTKLAKVFQATKFKEAPMIGVSAHPADGSPVGLDKLAALLVDFCPIPVRSPAGPFVFAVDHCFPIKGQGTVLTGTVLSGAVEVNDTIEIPSLKLQKKTKSLQMFRRPVPRAIQGDRVGICVTQFDSKLLERGLACTPGAVLSVVALVAEVAPIRFYKAPCLSRAKFHVSIGHQTVMATVTFFCSPPGGPGGAAGSAPDAAAPSISASSCAATASPGASAGAGAASAAAPEFNFSQEFLAEDALHNSGVPAVEGVTTFAGPQFALVELETPVLCLAGAMLIASRLDSDIHVNTCRLAFTGRMLAYSTEPEYRKTFVPRLLVFKRKQREGVVDRLHDGDTVIVRGLFKKETQLDLFAGLRVTLATGEQGIIEGGFGQGGKVRVRCMRGLLPSTVAQLRAAKKGEAEGGIAVTLEFKRFVFDESKKMVQ